MQRYNILRQANVKYSVAHKAAYSAAGFVAALKDAGGDPSLYPDLGRKLPSGPPRKDTPKNKARAERYHKLKAMGLNGIKASRYSNSAGLFEFATRRLEQGLPVI